MKTVRILRWLELLLVVITCLYNFSPAIYQKLADRLPTAGSSSPSGIPVLILSCATAGLLC